MLHCGPWRTFPFLIVISMTIPFFNISTSLTVDIYQSDRLHWCVIGVYWTLSCWCYCMYHATPVFFVCHQCCCCVFLSSHRHHSSSFMCQMHESLCGGYPAILTLPFHWVYCTPPHIELFKANFTNQTFYCKCPDFFYMLCRVKTVCYFDCCWRTPSLLIIF